MKDADPKRLQDGLVLGLVPVRRTILCLFLWLSATLLAQAATFTASLDRNAIPVGESATLSLTFEGGTPKRLPMPQIPNLTIQSLGSRQQFTAINGQMTASVSVNFQVTASKPGDYVIPSIQAEVDNQTLTSQPIAFKVTKSGGATGLAFVKLIPSKETVYVGETFPIELQLYLGTRQDSLQLPQIEGDGFIFSKMPNQPAQANTQVGNQTFTVLTFRLSAVAVKTGPLTMGPAQCSLVLHVASNPRGRSLLDDFFGGVQRKPVTLTSETPTITVLPLPTENRPADFNGAVGNFSMVANASPTNVTAGDPITLRLQIAGQGNLDALPFPGGTEWTDFKLYQPTSKTETSDPIVSSGVKSFERVVIPQKPEVRELPGITLSFFDPEQKAYRSVHSPSIPITVRPSDSAPPQPTVLANTKGGEETPPVNRDIVHIKPYLGTLESLQAPLVLRPWFLALQSVPFGLWLCAVIWRKRRDTLDNNPRLRRRMAVSDTVRKGLKTLASLAAANDSEAFFASVFRLLQEQLGERLDLPASAITEAVLDERLRERAPEELINQLHGLFQLCNQARYAPQRSPQELMDLVPRVEQALGELRQLPEFSEGVRS